MSELSRSLVIRCVFSLLLFVLALCVQVKPLEHGWATLMSLCPDVEYSYTDSEDLYANILRWEEPKQNYNRSFGVILSTRCTYFPVWAMCVPFFMRRKWFRTAPMGCLPALVGSFIFVSGINFVRLLYLFCGINADIPWWLAHDVPNILFTCLAVALSVVYFLRNVAPA